MRSSPSQTSVRRLFHPRMELLERRAMMAALDDDCVIVGGLAVAPEGESPAVQLYFGGPAAPAFEPSTTGSSGTGAEAESSLDLAGLVTPSVSQNLLSTSTQSSNVAATGSTHSHGVIGSLVTHSASDDDVLAFSAKSAAASDSAGSAIGSDRTAKDSSIALQTITGEGVSLLSAIAVTHGTHEYAPNAAPVLAVHATHSAVGVDPTTSAAANSSAHGHTAVFTASHNSPQISSTEIDSDGANAVWQSQETDDGSHHKSKDSSELSEASDKFAAKRCTVRYTSKEVNRDVSGDRKCDCPQKAAADEAARQRDAVDEVITSGAPSLGFSFVSLTASGSDCVPCQRDFLAGNNEVGHGHRGGLLGLSFQQILPMEENLEGGCPARDEVVPSAEEAGATAFYEGLQLVGFTLLGTSLLAIPWNRKKAKQQPSREDEFEPAADWLFRRLAFECQPR